MLGILVIAAVNGVVLFYMSLFAAPGGVGALYTVWAVGYTAITLTTLGAMFLVSRGRSGGGVTLAILTLPGLWAGSLVLVMAGTAYDLLRPSSVQLKEACVNVGAQYLAQPATPVRSVAWDWEPGTRLPDINHYTLDWMGNMWDQRGGIGYPHEIPKSIEFNESRCCQLFGGSRHGGGDYVHNARSGPSESRTELSADALAYIRVSKRSAGGVPGRLRILEIEVKDRRDGRLLATFRGVVDAQANRACGESSPGRFDEREFVYQAVGAR